jgi:hypothetical protein
MYGGMKGLLHRHVQKNKTVNDGVAVAVSTSTATSDPIIVRGYDSLVVYGSKTGSSTEVEIQILPVDVDEVTVGSNPISTFTLTATLLNDNVSLAKGRPAVAIKIVNDDSSNADVVTTKVVATWT